MTAAVETPSAQSAGSADGRVVRRRWSMPVPDATYSTDLSFTDGTHQWYDHGATVTVVDHINEWRIR